MNETAQKETKNKVCESVRKQLLDFHIVVVYSTFVIVTQLLFSTLRNNI